MLPALRTGSNTKSVPGRLAIAALGALLLSACDRLRQMEYDHNAVAVGLSNSEVRHPIGFTPRSETLDVEVPRGGRGLSPNQHVDVYRFLYRYRHEAAGGLVITTPEGARGRAAMAEIQQQAAQAGIDYRVLRGTRHAARTDGMPFIRLAFRRPVAVPPQCGDWTEDVGRNESRIPYPNWGCATQRNLAVMVDNSRDLGQPQPEDPRSSERRSTSWSAYAGSPSGSAPSGEGADAGKKAASAQKK